MIYVTFSNVMVLLGYQSPFILIQFGWLVSWFYLRFIKQNEGMDFRGDRSETFAFSSWFPPFLQPYVAQLSRFVFGIAVKLHILRPWGPSNDMETGHVNTRAEAERRRALALKALDQRLASKPSASSATAAAAAAGAGSSGSGPSVVSGASGVTSAGHHSTARRGSQSNAGGAGSVTSPGSNSAALAHTLSAPGGSSAGGGSKSKDDGDVMFDAAREEGNGSSVAA